MKHTKSGREVFLASLTHGQQHAAAAVFPPRLLFWIILESWLWPWRRKVPMRTGSCKSWHHVYFYRSKCMGIGISIKNIVGSQSDVKSTWRDIFKVDLSDVCTLLSIQRWPRKQVTRQNVSLCFFIHGKPNRNNEDEVWYYVSLIVFWYGRDFGVGRIWFSPAVILENDDGWWCVRGDVNRFAFRVQRIKCTTGGRASLSVETSVVE